MITTKYIATIFATDRKPIFLLTSFKRTAFANVLIKHDDLKII